KAAIPRVQEIIGEALNEFEDWAREMIVSPTIQKLKNTLEQIRREELARYLKNASPAEAARLDEMSRSFMQKILKYPVLHLKAAFPRVQEIIGEALNEFEDWAREMIVSPTIQKLKNTLEQIRREELARYLKNASPAEAARLDEMSRSFMQKILKYPVLHLKAACRRGDSESISELLHDLFNLERVREKKP